MVTHSYRTGKTPDNYAFIKAVMDRLGIWYQRLPNELKLNEHHLEMNENQLDNWENDGSPFLGDRAQLSLHMLYNQVNSLPRRLEQVDLADRLNSSSTFWRSDPLSSLPSRNWLLQGT